MGLVLAGGQSSRMGENKALLKPFGANGPTMLERAASTLAKLAPVCYVSCAKGGAYGGFDCIEDGFGPPGPAKGVYAGLLKALDLGYGGIIALACDLPLLCPGLLARLCAEHQQDWATLYVNCRTGRVEMLAGVYSISFQPVLSKALAEGKRSLYWILGADHCKMVAYGRDLEPYFMNCNTPADLMRVKAAAGLPSQEPRVDLEFPGS